MAIKFAHLPVDKIRITSPFGEVRGAVKHDGTDLGAKIAGVQGDNLYAVADGEVIVSKVNGGGVRVGYGYYCVIQHNGFMALYGHMQKLEVVVGQEVKAGQIIGHMGSTGSSTAAHLHFRLIEGSTLKFDVNPTTKMTYYSVDPTPYFNIEEVTPTVKLGYEKIRFGGHTDVHIYRSLTVPELVLGKRDALEYLPDIVSQYAGTKAAINCQMFSYDGTESDGYGVLISANGDRTLTVAKYFSNSSPSFADCIAWKDGTITIEVVKDYSVNATRLANIQKNAHFAFGSSYALKIKGVDSKLNWEKFPHVTSYTNRTMFGKGKDGLYYFLVADCGSYDKGLRAVDQVALCNQLQIFDAVNCDGGGSSEIFLAGKGIVSTNYKADRKIASVLIIR